MRVAVACGECWERAIRDDERAAVWFGVPREIEPDPLYVDEVAVERAVTGGPAGSRPRLTRAEQLAAVAVLVGRGWSGTRISERLGIGHATFVDLFVELRTAAVPDTDAGDGPSGAVA